ncbi:hypothetical protein FBEOM_11099 [Fusarium beomiforme]|uniref:Uncharacterized protein n=1 Tax=Fusarium beomiforme TaxID=44412 RepID=A0A9P5AAM6_9HYPO|nr:hypothetical protein FBEOM_11099 [Fusarium beomiforme]
MNNQGDAMFDENEAQPTHQRNKPRDIKDLTGHLFGTVSPGFESALTILFTARADQGASGIPEDLTIIQRITTSHTVQISTGTTGLALTLIDGTEYIPSSTKSETTTLSEASQSTSLSEATDIPVTPSSSNPSLSPSSPLNTSSDESYWTTSYTAASGTELLPSSHPTTPSETPAPQTVSITVFVVIVAVIFMILLLIAALALGGKVLKRRQDNSSKGSHENNNNMHFTLNTRLFNDAEAQPQVPLEYLNRKD